MSGVESGSSSRSRALTTAGRCTDSHVADGFTVRRLTSTVRRASESDTRPITRASCSHQPSLPARALRRSREPAPSQPGSPRKAIDPLVGDQWSCRHRFGAERVNGDRRGSVAAQTNDGADGGSPNAGPRGDHRAAALAGLPATLGAAPRAMPTQCPPIGTKIIIPVIQHGRRRSAG